LDQIYFQEKLSNGKGRLEKTGLSFIESPGKSQSQSPLLQRT
jgi:hypothetical protein